MTLTGRTVRAIAVAVVALAPLSVSAQSSLAVADAAKFLGAWQVALNSPQGAFTLNLTIADKGGKVAGEISAEMLPTQEITDITKEGEDLVMKYTSEFQGNAFNVRLTMSVNGSSGKVVFDAADGQFVVEGAAEKR